MVRFHIVVTRSYVFVLFITFSSRCLSPRATAGLTRVLGQRQENINDLLQIAQMGSDLLGDMRGLCKCEKVIDLLSTTRHQ